MTTYFNKFGLSLTYDQFFPTIILFTIGNKILTTKSVSTHWAKCYNAHNQRQHFLFILKYVYLKALLSHHVYVFTAVIYPTAVISHY